MTNQKFEQIPTDLSDKIEKMIRKLSKEDQLALYRELQLQIGGDQRKSNRKKFFNEIMYTSSLGAHSEYTRDISEDGLFIETPIPFKVGEKLSLTFPLKEQSEHIKLSGEIVRKTDNGIGVKFHPIDQDKHSLLKTLLESL